MSAADRSQNKLPERLLVIGNAMFFHQRNEVRRRVLRQRRLREVRIRGEEMLRPRIDVGEIAAPAAGDQDFLAGPIGTLDQRDAPPALASLDGAHEPRSPSAKNKNIEFLHRPSSPASIVPPARRKTKSPAHSEREKACQNERTRVTYD